MTPTERREVATEIANQWRRQLNRQPISPEDLGYILPSAVGLILGRSTLTPAVAIAIFEAYFKIGQAERLIN